MRTPTLAIATSLLALMVTLLFAESASACRIEPRPWPQPTPQPRRMLPIQTKSHSVDIEIKDQVAHVNLTAVFHNPNGRQMEGDYWFPIAPDVALDGFEMTVNGKTANAEILDADKARKIYEGIVRRNQDPGLLEYIGHRMIQCRVFPIPANGDVKVNLSYTQMLRSAYSLVDFSYPLASAKPHEGTNGIGKLTINLKISSKHPIQTIFSPSHKVEFARDGGKKVTASLTATNVIPKADFRLYYSRSDKAVGLDLLSFAELKDPGYFAMMVTPNLQEEKSAAIAKDIVFAIDTSGSMEGEKIKQARGALMHCIKGLRDGDRFNIVAFSTTVRTYRDELITMDDEVRKHAASFVDTLRASGGTAIEGALDNSLKQLSSPAKGHVPMLVFLTDGLPTIGERNVKLILEQTAKNNGELNARVFTFGVGYDVNTDLLDTLAADHRGSQEYVAPEEDLEVKVSGLFDKISYPALADVTLKVGEGVEVFDVYPPRMPDLFRGEQLMVMGRFNGKGEVPVTLSGNLAGQKVSYNYKISFDRSAKNGYLSRLWAMRKVGYLLEDIRRNGETEETVAAIQKLGKKYGIVTPYTSYLIVEDELLDQIPELGRIMNEERESFSKDKAGRRAVEGAERTRDMKQAQANGAGAFEPATPDAGGYGGSSPGDDFDLEHSGGELAKEELDAFQRSANRAIRMAGKDAFYFEDGIYVRSDLTEEDVKNAEACEYLSEDWFKLAEAHPELREQLKLGKDIILKADDRVIHVK